MIPQSILSCGAVAQLVECYNGIVEVAGSNLVSSTIFYLFKSIGYTSICSHSTFDGFLTISLRGGFSQKCRD